MFLLSFISGIASQGQVYLTTHTPIVIETITNNTSIYITNSATAVSSYPTYFNTFATNAAVNLYLSDGSFIRVQPNTTFSIDIFDQSVEKYNTANVSLVDVTNVVNVTHTLLEGEISLLVNAKTENDMFALQLPQGIIVFESGSYVIRADAKTAVIYSLSGKFKVQEGKSSVFVDYNGPAILGLFNVEQVGKSKALFSDQVMVSLKNIDVLVLSNLTTTFVELDKLRKNVVFVTIPCSTNIFPLVISH